MQPHNPLKVPRVPFGARITPQPVPGGSAALAGLKRAEGAALPGWGVGRCSDTVMLQQKLLRAGAACAGLGDGSVWPEQTRAVGSGAACELIGVIWKGVFATVGRVKHPRPPVLGSDAHLGGRAFSFAFSRRSPLSRRFYPALTSFFHEFPPGRRSFALFQRADGIYSRRPLPAGRTACAENRRRNVGGPEVFAAAGDEAPGQHLCLVTP